MRCPACGAQMGLEDAVCPYCGTPNAQAAQHQSDMAHYRREYRETQADVLAETSLMRQHGSWLAVLAVLLVALVAGIVLNFYAWDIGYSLRVDSVERSAAQDGETLDRYLEQGDYAQFLGYYDANDISLGNDSANPYQALHMAASSYVNLVQYAGAVRNPDDFQFRPDHIADTCEYVARDLNRIFTVEQHYAYDLDKYLPADKAGHLDEIRGRAGAIAQAYFGLSAEDVEDIPNISERKLARMIEEGIAK